jgi:hypothetical protein
MIHGGLTKSGRAVVSAGAMVNGDDAPFELVDRVPNGRLV